MNVFDAFDAFDAFDRQITPMGPNWLRISSARRVPNEMPRHFQIKTRLSFQRYASIP